MKSLRFSSCAVLLLVIAALVATSRQQASIAKDETRPVVGLFPSAWEHRVIEVVPFDAKQMETLLDEAGAQRWECVGVAYRGNAGGAFAIMKRRKSQ